jgi:glycosyltransferase involved in cell wall biosynthesis
MKVVISNGLNKFHLAALAAEMARRKVLAGLITAGYPIGWQRSLAERFARHPRWQRFLDRWEPIEERLVHSFAASEFLFHWGNSLLARSESMRRVLDSAAMHAYGLQASGILRKLRPDVYHYRSCFGLRSVAVAKRQGAVTLCDHSIAHPRTLSFLVDNSGRFPPEGGVPPKIELERLMDHDMVQADHTLVNSEFAKRTCVHAGMNPNRVHVIYLGVDDKFIDAVPELSRSQIRNRRAESILFAGSWQIRKGVWTIVHAFKAMKGNCHLNVAGGIEPKLGRDPKMKAFLRGPQVTVLGTLTRAELARKMTEHRIFIFPSLCEGSARVVFEALACGCYVITTPNAGSIVEDGIHGRLMPTADAEALRESVDWAMAHADEVAEIGWENAQLVRSHYRQCHYGDKVLALYHKLAGK